jgi:hypothetical protein
MNPRRTHAAAGLALVLLGSLLHAQCTLSEKRGDMEARLTVEAAKGPPLQGFGALTLTLSVTGPATLEVEEPRLGDPTSEWKEERLTSTHVVEKRGATWSQVIRLKQAKKGVAPVPEVSVRFRAGPDATWEEAKWVNIFKGSPDAPRPPAPPPEERSWLRRWGFAIILGLTGLLLVGAWIARRRRTVPAPPLPPDQYALRELERIERTLLPPQGDPEAYHTQLSHIVRRYLAERFGLHALTQTTAEFLEAVRQVPQLSAEQQALLRDVFERCDLAKFARATTPPEECRRTAESARALVRQTTAAQSLPSAEADENLSGSANSPTWIKSE